MNRTIWETPSVQVKHVQQVDRATGLKVANKNLFQIQLPLQTGQILTPSDIVHIPSVMQPYFFKNAVRQFTTEVLPSGRLASRLLQGEPSVLVTAIVTDSGKRLSGIPRQLKVVRNFLFGCSVALFLMCIWLSSVSITALLPAFISASGMLAFRAANDIPAD